MFRKSPILWVLAPIVTIGVAGCSEVNLRKGPDPVIDSSSVEAAVRNQNAIMRALALDAGYNPDGSVDYYGVAQAGFNYVDDQCRAYFDQIFFIDRERSQLKSGLAAASATTAAILGVTNASTMSLAIVASAFGFASSATDILAGTYLYSLPPATTQGFVNKLQAAFRDGAAANRANINSPTAAYYAIQRYLSLCLPPTIEAEITKQVNSTVAVGFPVGAGSLVSVQTASNITLPRAPLARAHQQVGGGVAAQAKPQPQQTLVKHNRGAEPVPPEMSQFFLAYNPEHDTPSYVNDVLKRLCAPDFPDTGQAKDRSEWVAKVKALIRIYEDTPQLDFNEATPTKDGKINESEGRTILASGECGPGIRNYFEKRTFDTNNLPDSSFISHFYKALGRPIPEGLSLDKLRPDIREANTKLGLSKPGAFISDQITPDLEKKLLDVIKK